MPIISINMPDELHEQLAEAIELSKGNAQDFILRAIAEKIANSNAQAELEAMTEASYAEFLRSGETVTLEEVRRHFQRRLAGDLNDKFIFEKSKP